MALQTDDPTAMLNFYRKLAALRRAQPALYVGEYTAVDPHNHHVFAYQRTAGSAAYLIVLNFTGEPQEVNITEPGKTATLVLSTDMQRSGIVTLSNFTLAPNQGLILQI